MGCRYKTFSNRILTGIILAGVAVGVVSPAPVAWAETIAATEVMLGGDAQSTTFTLTMTNGLKAQVFTLANPYRVILDLPDLTFRLDAAASQTSKGLVTAFRYGLFAEHKSRIVIDTSGPVKIASAAMTRAGAGKTVKLAIVLVPMDPVAFGAGTGPGRTAAAEPASTMAPSAVAKPKNPARPVIVIDPGHGGIDPGAIGANNMPEKTVVLAVAQKLSAALRKTGTFDVKMTRTEDVFVSLDRRLKFSADNAADLFVSLHADSIDPKESGAVHGATIYTLADRASDEQARAMAEKENASDLIAGIDAGNRADGDQVRNILFDLLKRETSNFSAEFSRGLAKRLGKTIDMSKIPQRSAAFKVLKQTHAPSVLVELGYISNQSDEQQMASAAWQEKVAASIAGAIQTYFGERTAARP